MVADEDEIDRDLIITGMVERFALNDGKSLDESSSVNTPLQKELPVTNIRKKAKLNDHVQMVGKAIFEKRLGDAERNIEKANATALPASDVAGLLGRLARAYRQAKDYKSARETYQRLVDEYGSTTAGRNALVALAQLELGTLGDSNSALGNFNRYISSSPLGLLIEEAWLGRVRAQTKLGRQTDVIETVNQYLGQRQGGIATAEMLLRRGEAKRKTGDCHGALLDYKILGERWPNSKNASLAAAGIKLCKKKSPK